MALHACLTVWLATWLLLQPAGAVGTVPAEQQWCSRVEQPGLSNFSQLYECPEVPGVLLVPYLWKPVTISIKCPTSWYSVYTAPDEKGLKHSLEQQDAAWCGWGSLVDGSTCVLQVSPFQRTLVAIKSGRGCTISSSADLSPLMLVSGVAGLLLFCTAGFLSTSFVFRLSCGTALFTAGSFLLLLVILMRVMPHKRTMAAVLTAAGSGGLAMIRWLTGQWLPSWRQLVAHPVFGAYIALSALLGAIITYIYDDMRNPKVNTVIKATLRVMALAMTYYSTWTCWPVSATAIGVLVASLMGPGVAKGVQETSAKVQHVAQLLTTPFTAKRAARRPLPADQARDTVAAGAGKGVGASMAGGAVAVVSPNLLQQRQQLFQHAPAHLLPGTLLQPGEVDTLAPRDYSGLTPVHLKLSPPASWEVRPGRRVATFEEQMLKAVTRQGRQGSRGNTADTGGLPQGSAAGASHSRLSQLGEEEGGEGAGVSQVVRSGYILNPASGRLIKIGGDVYNRLLEEGYVPDAAVGTMVAPEGGAPRSHGPVSAGRRSSRLSGGPKGSSGRSPGAPARSGQY